MSVIITSDLVGKYLESKNLKNDHSKYLIKDAGDGPRIVRWDFEVLKPSKETLQNFVESLNKDMQLKEVYMKRLEEYPSTADQLDLLYHEGIEGWRSKIKQIKDKYPKPI